MGELRLLREIRRCRLVIPRGIAKNIGDRLGIRAVVLPQGQYEISDLLSYVDALGFPSLGSCASAC